MKTRVIGWSVAGLIALAPLGACNEDIQRFGVADLAGSWVATTFTSTPTGGATENVLAAGGSLTMTLIANGSVTGNLNIPASITGGPLTASMAGTFSTVNGVATFNQSADTFVRDMEFSYSGGNTLSATEAFTGGSVTVVLTKQ